MLLWKDFAKEESCDNCPLLENEICKGGFVCYGGKPIEPPCTCFEDDTDLDAWVDDYFEQKKRREEFEESRLREARKKKERAKKAADTRRALRWYCFAEIQALKQAEKSAKEKSIGNLKKLKKDEGAKRVQQKDRRRNAGLGRNYRRTQMCSFGTGPEGPSSLARYSFTLP